MTVADVEASSSLIADMATRARAASKAMATASSAAKARALMAAAACVRQAAPAILGGNRDDVAQAEQAGMAPAMLDRLTLDPARLEAMASAVDAVANLHDPVGVVIDENVRPNGLRMTRLRVPIGVVGIIF